MKHTTLFFFSILLSLILTAQPSKVLESLEFESQVMVKNIKYSVYLPYDYDVSNRQYPIVYLLHGYGNDENSWIQLGNMKEQVDKAIAKGEIPPMVVIMPDGGVSFYVDDYQNKTQWQSMFLGEFMGFAEKEYRVRGERRYRAVAGLSMGGFGSLVLAMKRPDLFASCVAFSAAAWTNDDVLGFQKGRAERHQKMFGGTLEGEGRITEHWMGNSPWGLASTQPVDSLNKVSWYIDSGDDDKLTDGSCSLHILWNKRGVNHEFRVRDGRHKWEYWRTGLIDGLKFISKTFQ